MPSMRLNNNFNNLINEFSSIRKAAKYFCVYSSTIRRVLNKDMTYNEFFFNLKLKITEFEFTIVIIN